MPPEASPLCNKNLPIELLPIVSQLVCGLLGEGIPEASRAMRVHNQTSVIAMTATKPDANEQTKRTPDSAKKNQGSRRPRQPR